MNDHAKGLVLGREQLRCSIFYEIGKNRARIRFLSRVLALGTPILVDFWIFSDQAQLLDPESAASKEPRSGLVA